MTTSTQVPAATLEDSDWVATIRGELFDSTGGHPAIVPGVLVPARHAPNDMEIALSARNVLQWTTYLPKDSFTVQVDDGWITLFGDVDWEYQRLAALRAVCNLNGVTGVVDQIAIKPATASRVVSSGIAAAMQRYPQVQL